MKSVMLSIQPKWVEKIVKGEKTIEVRKSRPKIDTPFKCYIYCTKPSKKYQTICGCMVINTDELYRLPNGKIKHDWSGELMCCNGEYTRDNFLNGKVIGEFVCDEIVPIIWDRQSVFCPLIDDLSLEKMSQLDLYEIEEYLSNKNGYGWHISDLKIYDKPKELSEFTRPCSYDGICSSCKRFIANGMSYGFCDSTITRPPQSWQYVEELEKKWASI